MINEFYIIFLHLPHVSISSILVQIEVLGGNGAGIVGQIVVETAALVALVQIIIAIGIGERHREGNALQIGFGIE